MTQPSLTLAQVHPPRNRLKVLLTTPPADNGGEGNRAESGSASSGSKNDTLANSSSDPANNNLATESGNKYTGDGGQSTGGNTVQDNALFRIGSGTWFFPLPSRYRGLITICRQRRFSGKHLERQRRSRIPHPHHACPQTSDINAFTQQNLKIHSDKPRLIRTP